MIAPKCSGVDTTQPAHVQIKSFGGMATKPSDIFVIPACHNCHNILDGRVKSDLSKEFVELLALRAVHRKIQRLLDSGLVKI